LPNIEDLKRRNGADADQPHRIEAARRDGSVMMGQVGR